MEILKTREELNVFLHKKAHNQSLGFVPTMGALHQGHISLIRTSVKENDFTIASIFVNPTQFNNKGDFDKYPRTVEQDIQMLVEAKCNAVFIPNPSVMYPYESMLKFDFGLLESTMEGKFRPGHFNGVALVVSKFFNLIKPNRTYFGQKDFQQVAVIKALVKSLYYEIEVRVLDTLREESGLAMSSRNKRLNNSELIKAAYIYQMLLKSKQEFIQGESANVIRNQMRGLFENAGFTFEYLSIVNSSSLEDVEIYSNKEQYAICVAVFLGDVRLIDNIVF